MKQKWHNARNYTTQRTGKDVKRRRSATYSPQTVSATLWPDPLTVTFQHIYKHHPFTCLINLLFPLASAVEQPECTSSTYLVKELRIHWNYGAKTGDVTLMSLLCKLRIKPVSATNRFSMQISQTDISAVFIYLESRNSGQTSHDEPSNGWTGNSGTHKCYCERQKKEQRGEMRPTWITAQFLLLISWYY